MTLSSSTPLCEIIKGCEDSRPVSAIAQIRAEKGPTWAMILMACEREQFAILQNLWDRYPPDDETISVMYEIVKRGCLLDFLDPNDKRQRNHFQLLVACVANGKIIGREQAASAAPRRRR